MSVILGGIIMDNIIASIIEVLGGFIVGLITGYGICLKVKKTNKQVSKGDNNIQIQTGDKYEIRK